VPQQPSLPSGGDPSAAGPLLRLIGDQRIAFVVVGGINTVVGLGWFVLVHTLAGSAIGYMGSLVVAYAFAILTAFVMHRRFVFKVRGQVWLDLARFTMVNLSSLAINAALLPVAVEVVGLPVVPAQVLVTALTVCLSYFGHLWFSFRRQHAGPGYPAEPVDD
jgi:putative flippase GtrA